MINNNYTEINSKAWDKWGEDGIEWSIPTSSEEFAETKNGKWDVVLTPQKPVPHEWFLPFLKNERLDGVKLLGLASGGGQQMPIFAALGADCTVMDYSDNQLNNERIVSEREGYSINIVKADMTKLLPFDDNSFDVIFHPVSNCYIEDVYHVWNECFRVLRKGGVLLSGVNTAVSFLCDESNPLLIVNKMPYNPLKDKEVYEKCMQEDGSLQFSHSLEEQIGGQLKVGFVLADLYEDHGTEVMDEYIPAFVATRAVKM